MKILKILIIFMVMQFSTVAFSATASILDIADRKKYKAIFALQQDGKWKQADVHINKINNKILLGQVLFQRYMHPTAYRAKYKELHMWLIKYNDHPGSSQVYKLAKRRKPGGWKKPTAPKGRLVPNSQYNKKKYSHVAKPKFKSRTSRILNTIRQNVQRGNVTAAKSYLNKNLKFLSRPAHAEAYGHIARGYYRYHKSAETLTVADLAFDMDENYSWEANWWSGLSAFRDGKYSVAEKYFVRIAKSNRVGDWIYSAGWYWAGRSAQKIGDSGRAYSHWKKASHKVRTFYGLLAMRSLGSTPDLDFSVTSTNNADLQNLLRITGFKRAVALSEIGLIHRADRELKYIQPQVKESLQLALMQSSVSFKIPHVQLKTANFIESKMKITVPEGYLYPTVPYNPYNGWTVDKALVSAFIRQESQFSAYAKSSAGAMGLMQLMPRTARFIARRTKVKPNSFHGLRRNFLYRPELSMTLGQSYIEMLLTQEGYENNLFYVVAAYNAGPGNLKKWRKKVNYKDDPLLFIESIPSRETRLYMEKIFSNFWIYRLKKNGTTPSLDMVSNGQWPIYERLD